MSLAALAAALVLACTPPVPDEPAAAWRMLCQRCHGEAGRGPGKPEAPPKLDLRTSRSVTGRDLAAVREQIRVGGGAMPAFGRKLTPEQLEAIARYTIDLVAPADSDPSGSSAGVE